MSNNSSKKNWTKRPNLASVCFRYGLSNYAGVAITSATLVDYGIITKVNTSQIIIGLEKLGDERRRCWEKRGEKQSLEI